MQDVYCRFAHPFLALMMFVPCSLVGLLIPRVIWNHFPLSQDAKVLKTSKEVSFYVQLLWASVNLGLLYCVLF